MQSKSLIDTLGAFSNSISDTNALEQRQTYYNAHLKDFIRDFYTIKINSSEIKDSITNILTRLNIPTIQWGRYLGASLTVHDFLIELKEHNKNKDQVQQIETWIAFIKEQRQAQLKKLSYVGLGLLLAIAIAAPFFVLYGGLTGVIELFNIPLFLPIAAVSFIGGASLGALVYNLSDKKTPWSQRLQDAAFLTVKVGLQLTGFGLTVAAGVFFITPFIASFLILAQVVNVIEKVTRVVQWHQQNKHLAPLPNDATLAERQLRARYDMESIKRRNSLIISVGTAVCVALIIAGWCFLPGGLFLIIPVLVSVGLVVFGQHYANKRSEAALANRLKNKFEELEKESSEALSVGVKALLDNPLNESSTDKTQRPVENIPDPKKSLPSTFTSANASRFFSQPSSSSSQQGDVHFSCQIL